MYVIINILKQNWLKGIIRCFSFVSLDKFQERHMKGIKVCVESAQKWKNFQLISFSSLLYAIAKKKIFIPDFHIPKLSKTRNDECSCENNDMMEKKKVCGLKTIVYCAEYAKHNGLKCWSSSPIHNLTRAAFVLSKLYFLYMQKHNLPHN